MKQKYQCPKCKADTLCRTRKASKRSNYAHFQCRECGRGLLAEYDPKDLRVVEAS